MESSVNRTVPVLLLWLEQSVQPVAEHFAADPPHPVLGPEPWSLLEMAVVYALHTSREDGLVPWIKAGDEIIGPERLKALLAARDDTASL